MLRSESIKIVHSRGGLWLYLTSNTRLYGFWGYYGYLTFLPLVRYTAVEIQCEPCMPCENYGCICFAFVHLSFMLPSI
jgi:hypothetical protein